MLERIVTEPSPTIEGFRAIFRHPGLALAEVSWRWTFGAAASLLVLFTLVQYFDSLQVTTGDALFLKTRHPLLVSQAVGHMIAGSGERLLAAGIFVSLTLGAFWIVASSVGRAATIRPLLQYFSGAQVTPSDFTDEQPYAPPMRVRHLRSLAALNFLRLTLVLAGLLALVSSGILSSFMSTAKDPQPGLAFLTFIPLALLVVLSWSSMNWILSIAPLFVLRDQSDTFGAFASAFDFCLYRAGALSWSSTVCATCHFVAFAIASSVVVFPLALGWTCARCSRCNCHCNSHVAVFCRCRFPVRGQAGGVRLYTANAEAARFCRRRDLTSLRSSRERLTDTSAIN
jgi:hypothetical protein